MSQFDLLTRRRFGPFFATQFLGAFNDNLFKNAVVVLITFGIVGQSQSNSHYLVNLALVCLYCLSFCSRRQLGNWPTDINITLGGPAATFQQLMEGANGAIELSGGQSEGAKFEKWELNLLSRMFPSLGEKSIDQISCMVVELDVEDGVAHGAGAVMETQHAVVAGDGTADLRSEQLDLLLRAQPKNQALLDITASLKVDGSMRDPKMELVSANVAFGPITILRSVTHPISLLRSFFGSSGDNDTTACEAALDIAEKAHVDYNANSPEPAGSPD